MTEPDTANGHARNLGREVRLLPTPEANTATNGGSQHPDKRKAGGHSVNLQDVAEWMLLPTPTATPYGNNQSDSPGATVRPSLDTLAATLLPTLRATRGGSNTETLALLPTPTAHDSKGTGPSQEARNSRMLTEVGRLLPTPTAMDSKASGGSTPSDVTLTDAVVRTQLGACTNPRFADGNT